MTEPGDLCADLTHRCADALAALHEFLDSELGDDRRGLIEEHLRECSPCLEAFDFEADFRRVIRLRVGTPIPEDLRQRLLTALDDLDDPAPRAGRRGLPPEGQA